ncbi:MAG TPA: hypothetical protein VGG71_13455, partial [Chitinophagaceae bacterium]
EFVYFLQGKDAYNLYEYGMVGVNVGEERSVGLYTFEASYHGPKGGLNANSWTGIFNSYSGGVGAIGGSYFWSNQRGWPELYPGTWGGSIAWDGFSISGAIPVAGLRPSPLLPSENVGFKWSATDYWLTSPTPLIGAAH